MQFGFSLPISGPQGSADALATLARRAEELGFAFAAVGDHIVIPRNIESRYPYSQTGEFGSSGECLDPLTVLSFVAGLTSTLRLVTSVMVLPYRNPVHTAKALASIDVLSGGRLTVGCGVGWMEEEFEALGAPPYADRGTVSDEYILAFKELWTSDNPSLQGTYVSFTDIIFEPKPVQKPHPPIWVGGESPAAIRRAATQGDAWYPLRGNPRFPVDTPQQFSAAVDRLRRYAEAAGRDPSEIDIAFSFTWKGDPGTRSASRDQRALFTGAPEDIAADIHGFADMGVRHMRVGLQGATLPEILERMERFASEVAPVVRG